MLKMDVMCKKYMLLLSLRKSNQNARAVPKKLKNGYKSYSALNSGDLPISSKL